MGYEKFRRPILSPNEGDVLNKPFRTCRRPQCLYIEDGTGRVNIAVDGTTLCIGTLIQGNTISNPVLVKLLFGVSKMILVSPAGSAGKIVVPSTGGKVLATDGWGNFDNPTLQVVGMSLSTGTTNDLIDVICSHVGGRAAGGGGP